MDSFAKIIYLVVILGLGYYYYTQWKKFKEEQDKAVWPPITYECPDYWTSEIRGNKKVCKNTFDLGHCPSNRNGLPISQGTVNFNSDIYTGEDGNYNKCKWAKKCNVSWDGIDGNCA